MDGYNLTSGNPNDKRLNLKCTEVFFQLLSLSTFYVSTMFS